jgi:hypothetical protein
MKYPFTLKTQPCPVDQQSAASWTEQEREKAERGRHITSITALRGYVSLDS